MLNAFQHLDWGGEAILGMAYLKWLEENLRFREQFRSLILEEIGALKT
jgi:hypothetical protein